MQQILEPLDVQSALDLGANAGFFTLSLASAGVSTVAVESDPTFVRTLLYAIRKADCHNAGVMSIALSPTTVDFLPEVDAALVLSLWHHFVKGYGFDEATRMLARIWRTTRRVLFFDTGEAEMSPDFGLPPMLPTPREWIDRYLEDTCQGGTTRYLGEHAGFYDAPRSLFAVVRGDFQAAAAPASSH